MIPPLLRNQKAQLEVGLSEPSRLRAEPRSARSHRHELVHSDHTDSQNLPPRTRCASTPMNQAIGLRTPPATPLPIIAIFPVFSPQALSWPGDVAGLRGQTAAEGQGLGLVQARGSEDMGRRGYFGKKNKETNLSCGNAKRNKKKNCVWNSGRKASILIYFLLPPAHPLTRGQPSREKSMIRGASQCRAIPGGSSSAGVEP